MVETGEKINMAEKEFDRLNIKYKIETRPSKYQPTTPETFVVAKYKSHIIEIRYASWRGDIYLKKDNEVLLSLDVWSPENHLARLKSMIDMIESGSDLPTPDSVIQNLSSKYHYGMVNTFRQYQHVPCVISFACNSVIATMAIKTKRMYKYYFVDPLRVHEIEYKEFVDHYTEITELKPLSKKLDPELKEKIELIEIAKQV